MRVHFDFPFFAFAFFLKLDADESPVFLLGLLVAQVGPQFFEGVVADVSFYDEAAIGPHPQPALGLGVVLLL